jgi:hypothetical protein
MALHSLIIFDVKLAIICVAKIMINENIKGCEVIKI